MADRGIRMLVLGMVIGGLAAIFGVGSAASAWGWREGAAAHGQGVILVPAHPTQGLPLNPREFTPVPNPQNGQDRGPGQLSPGAGGQNCDKILYFYQGKLYQLRPGPMPKDGGNPEFYFMQPYEGPQIPGFPTPGPMTPGRPDPNNPGQVAPRHI
jgi:hypothetical protein